MKYFDTHCHLNGPFYESDIDEDIKLALEKNVKKILLPGTSKEDSLLAIEMAKKNPDVLVAAAGIHPSDAFSRDLVDYLEEINPNDIVAIGEVGIDLYRDTNPSLELQEFVFRKHIEYALKHNKPVLIHMREATNEVLNIVSEYKGLKFVLHSYTGDAATATKFVELGGYISFSGIVTFKNAKEVQEAAKVVPLNRMIVETDAPFLAPTPHRGKPNKPEYVTHVANFICSLREEDENEVLLALYRNSIELFGLEE